MGKKGQQWMLPVVALLFLLVAAYYYYLVRPVQADVQSLNNQVAQTQTSVQNAKNQGKTKADKPAPRSMQKIAELMPVTPYTDQLIKDLGKLQSISSVEITNASFSDENTINSKDLGQKFIPAVDPNKVTISQDKKNRVTEVQNAVNSLPPASIHTIEITLSVKGEYDKVYAFLYEVENLSRYLRLDSFSFGGGDKGKSGANGGNTGNAAANGDGNSMAGIIGNAAGQANAAANNSAGNEIQNGQNGTDAASSGDLTASIKLTTYFVPQFASLLDKQPAVQVEPPSGKWDPTQYPVLKKPERFTEQQP